MLIAPVHLDFNQLINTGAVRAPGLHASDLYGSFYKQANPNRYNKGDGGPAPLLLGTGLALESAIEGWLIEQFATGRMHEQAERPGEFHHSDIFDGYRIEFSFNPDLLIYNGETRLGEIKATWMSSKMPHHWFESFEALAEHEEEIADLLRDEKYDKYYTQIKLYLKCLHMTKARIYIWYVAGDYTRPYKSQLVARDLEFTQDEIDMEYAAMCYHGIAEGLITQKEG